MHVTPVRFWRARGLCQCQVCAVGFCPHLARLAKHKRTLKTVAERRLAQDRACTLLHQRAHWCSSSTGAAAAAAAAQVCACRTTLFAFCGWPSATGAREHSPWRACAGRRCKGPQNKKRPQTILTHTHRALLQPPAPLEEGSPPPTPPGTKASRHEVKPDKVKARTGQKKKRFNGAFGRAGEPGRRARRTRGPSLASADSDAGPRHDYHE